MAMDRHSRAVGWLKITLPLLALAILATLFLLADGIDPDAALPYAEVDVEGLAREPRMTAPTYAGTTSDGAALTLSADEARTATDGTPAGAQGLRLQLDTPDGAATTLTAATAVMNPATQEILLSGGVVITTSSGYRVETAALSAKMDRSGLQTQTPITATGPAGDLSAGGMTLGQDNRTPGGTPGAYLLVFNGGVRLVYQPGGQGP
jgi:lipopolysaccharide export system protein LptC